MDRQTEQTHDPSQDEKLLALFSHLSFFFGSLLIPFILWIVNKGRSKFVTFHSLQALFFHLAYTAVIVVIVGIGAIIGFITGFLTHGIHQHGPPDVLHMILLAAFGILIISVVLVSIVLSIITAVSAYKGGMKKYPIIGNIVYRKVYGIN